MDALEDLTGRTAVVTGAGSGIGRALARLLAARGATVHLAGHDPDRLAVVADELGERAVVHDVDVADPAAVEALGVAVTGPVHLLFSNAGIGHAGAVVDTPLEDWRRLVEVNLMGVVHGLRTFLPRMLAQGEPGHVVHTASVAGLVPNPYMVPYSTTKAAVVGLTKGLAVELRGTSVSVHALCPGVIDTDIVARSTMRGAFAARQAKAVRLYATRGTSPDVVARQALEGVARGKVVIASPRYQVTPLWLLDRVAPAAARRVSALTVRAVGRP